MIASPWRLDRDLLGRQPSPETTTESLEGWLATGPATTFFLIPLSGVGAGAHPWATRRAELGIGLLFKLEGNVVVVVTRSGPVPVASYLVH